MSRVFLIPGLGADCRIYKHIHIENHEVVQCNWIAPDLNDTLATYAQSIIKQFDIKSGDIVIGNSMGGIVAVEIAKKIPLKKPSSYPALKPIVRHQCISASSGAFRFTGTFPISGFLRLIFY